MDLFDGLQQFQWEEVPSQNVVRQGTYGVVFVSLYEPKDKPAEFTPPHIKTSGSQCSHCVFNVVIEHTREFVCIYNLLPSRFSHSFLFVDCSSV